MSVAFVDGRAVVASAGTAERISSTSAAATSITITAETDNTGIMVVGNSTVVATLASRRGAPLAAGDSITITPKGLEAIDIKNIWIDATVTGDGVTFLYQTETFGNQV